MRPIVKLCASGRKNPLSSATMCKEMFDLVSTEWENNSEFKEYSFDSSHVLSQSTAKVSLCKRQKLVPIALNHSHYLQILQLYKDDSPHLANLLFKYRAALSSAKGAPQYLHLWRPQSGVLTRSEQQWKDKIDQSSSLNATSKVTCTNLKLSCCC